MSVFLAAFFGGGEGFFPSTRHVSNGTMGPILGGSNKQQMVLVKLARDLTRVLGPQKVAFRKGNPRQFQVFPGW